MTPYPINPKQKKEMEKHEKESCLQLVGIRIGDFVHYRERTAAHIQTFVFIDAGGD